MGSRTATDRIVVDLRSGVEPARVEPLAVVAPESPWPRRIVWGASVAFAIVFGGLVLYLHTHLGTRAFDLGIFDQGLWLLSQGETPFVTMRGLHLFGDHSSFILYFLVPLYWIWSDVVVVMIVTVLAMAAGGPLVYAVARRKGVSNGLAAALGVSFPLMPAVQWQTWDVFHPEALAVPLLLAAYLLTLKSRPVWAFAMLLLVLLAKEDAPLVIVPLALYLGWRARNKWLAMAGAGAGIAAFIINFAVLLPHWSPTGQLVYTGRYRDFGDSMPGVVWGVLTSPGDVLRLGFDGDGLIYVIVVVLPLFLSLLAPEVLLIAIPTLLGNLLSVHTYQAQVEYHYTAYLIPVVAIAAIVGARRLEARTRGRGRRAAIATTVVAALIGSVLGGPWGIGHRSPWAGHSDRPDLVSEALAVIPGDAKVTADSRIAVRLAHRTTVYVFPNPHQSQNWSAGGVNPAPVDDFDWLAVRADLAGMDEPFLRALEEITGGGRFERVIANDEVTVWRRTVVP